LVTGLESIVGLAGKCTLFRYLIPIYNPTVASSRSVVGALAGI
jgi:hypothetical protein